MVIAPQRNAAAKARTRAIANIFRLLSSECGTNERNDSYYRVIEPASATFQLLCRSVSKTPELALFSVNALSKKQGRFCTDTHSITCRFRAQAAKEVDEKGHNPALNPNCLIEKKLYFVMKKFFQKVELPHTGARD